MKTYQWSSASLITLFFLISCSCERQARRVDPSPSASEPVEIARDAGAGVDVDDQPADMSAPPQGNTATRPPGELTGFFQVLEETARGRAVRVLHIGDSHVASDLMTGQLRRAFQGRFGEAGRGYVYAGKPWRHFRMEGVSYSMSKGWSRYNARGTTPGPFGFGGTRLVTDEEDATITRGASEEDGAPFVMARISFLTDPLGGSFEVTDSSGDFSRVFSTGGDEVEVASIDVVFPEPVTELMVRAVGDGPITLLGTSTRSGQGGVIYDALGLNGATARTFLRVEEEHARAELAMFAPDLIIITLGTNDIYNLRKKELLPEHRDEAEAGFVGLLARHKAAAPEAACVLMLPMDVMRKPRRKRCNTDQREAGLCDWTRIEAAELIEQAMRDVAAEHGCALWDARAAMGGPASILGWAAREPALAGKDGVHLRKLGYQMLGDALFADLMDAFSRFEAGEDATLKTTVIELPELEEQE